MKRWLIGCLSIILVISGCSIRMTTEEKIALYGDDSLLQIQEDAGIQIEQLASNQVPQMTTNWIQYSAELMGNTFLGLSPEETEQQVNEYYDYLLREEGITRETVEDVGVSLVLSNNGAEVSFSKDWMTYKKFPNAVQYAQTFYCVDYLYEEEKSGIKTPLQFRYHHLDSAFSDKELSGATKETAKAACDSIAGVLGFFTGEAEIYTMSAESMNQIQMQTGLPSLDTKTDEDGTIVGELKPWKKEQEAYLLLYKKFANDRIIESVRSENVLFFVYHPEQGVVFAEAINGVNGTTIIEESMQTVMSGEEAVAEAKLYFSQYGWTDVTITSAELNYMAPLGSYNYNNKQVRIEPCWDIEYRYMQNGVELTDHILLHAVTGIVATGDIVF